MGIKKRKQMRTHIKHPLTLEHVSNCKDSCPYREEPYFGAYWYCLRKKCGLSDVIFICTLLFKRTSFVLHAVGGLIDVG